MDSGSALRDGRPGPLACAPLPPPRCSSRSLGMVRAPSDHEIVLDIGAVHRASYPGL